MISCAEAALALACLAGHPADTLVDAALAVRVRALVAATWEVAPEEVTLAWHQTAELRDVPSGTPLRLTGSGAQGWFGLVLQRADGSPVAIRLRAGVAARQPSAARALDRGAVLGDSDVVMVAATHWGAPATVPSLPTLSGWEVRRPLQAGAPLLPPAIAAPVAVRTGGVVRLAWAEAGVRIVRETVALGTARIGETVRVRAGAEATPFVVVMTAPGLARPEEAP